MFNYQYCYSNPPSLAPFPPTPPCRVTWIKKMLPWRCQMQGWCLFFWEFGKSQTYVEWHFFWMFPKYSYSLFHPARPHNISLPPPYPMIGNQRCLKEGGNDGVPRQHNEGADPLFCLKGGRLRLLLLLLPWLLAFMLSGCCCCCCHGGRNGLTVSTNGCHNPGAIRNGMWLLQPLSWRKQQFRIRIVAHGEDQYIDQ